MAVSREVSRDHEHYHVSGAPRGRRMRSSYRSLTGASFVVEVSTPRVARDVTGSGGPAPSSHQFSPAVDTGDPTELRDAGTPARQPYRWPYGGIATGNAANATCSASPSSRTSHPGVEGLHPCIRPGRRSRAGTLAPGWMSIGLSLRERVS